jgi:HlyD family secretion protein
MNKRIRIIIAVVAVIVIGVTVKKFIFGDNFRYAGTLEATKIDLSARLAAAIDKVNVREGDRIKAGDLLVELACEDFKIANRLATENFERTRRLYKVGSASKEAMDLDTNRKQDADTRLDWCRVSSPIEGKVLSRYHEPGEWVNPGTKLLTVANIKDIWAYIYVPQTLISRLSVGMKVVGHLPEEGDRSFTGQILKINEEAEFTPKNVQTRSERERLVFGVKISFLESNSEEVLKPGMTLEVELPD